MFIKLFMLIWFMLLGFWIISLLSSSPWLLGLCVVICGFALYSILKERWRRKKEGYHVYQRGGAEDVILFYKEGEHFLQLYYDRVKDTVYIPSDLLWREIMPVWAIDRKSEIVNRVKQRVGKRVFGKARTFQETDDPHYIVPKETQDH